MKPADTVKHGPTGETWVIAAVSPRGDELSPAGWPETIANVADCELVMSAPDDKSRDMSHQCRNLPAPDIRRSWTLANDDKEPRP